MKKIKYLMLSLFLTSTFQFAIGQTKPTVAQSKNKQTVTLLNPTEFAAKIKETPKAQIVDVRTPSEFKAGYIAEAKNFDWNGGIFEKQTNNLDKTKPVFVYCEAGGRSAAAVAQMKAAGFVNIYELSGGMRAWRTSNMPQAKP